MKVAEKDDNFNLSFDVPLNTSKEVLVDFFSSPLQLWKLLKPIFIKPITLAIISLSTILLLWWQISLWGIVPELLLPSPFSITQAFLALLEDGYMEVSLIAHLSASLGRIGLALLLALVTAVPVGFVLGLSRIGRGLLDPLIELYRPVPPLAWLPLMIIWFGIGELSKILLIYLSVFAPLTITVTSSVLRVKEARLQAARTLGASRLQLLRHIILPSTLADTLLGMRVALGLAWSTLVAAELIAATEGIGFMLYAASKFMMSDVVISGIVIIAFVALGMEILLRYLQKRLTPWHKEL